MGYSSDEQMVRVDFFKPSGKWVATEAMRWHSYRGDIHTAFEESLRAEFPWNDGSGKIRYGGLTAVCLAPYHEHSHPIMMKVPEK
jgi:hypothetical protein